MVSDEQKYNIRGLDEYIRQGEPQQRERSEAWKVAIGLQQVDRLQTSEYLLDTAKRHIEGDISISEAKDLIDSYYKSVSGRKDIENDRTEEADKVAARITELIEEKTFSFTPAQLVSIHRRLFDGIYKLAGRIRDYNITKNEWVLGGKTVYYASYDTISETLDYDMGQERQFDYSSKNVDEAVRHLTRFCANLCMLLGEEHDLRNRIMHVDWGKVDGETALQSAKQDVKSAKTGEELPPKCKNCTLEEVAVLRIVQKNRYATQKEIAAEIGKSERTVKSITIVLQDKQILKRVNGKRNGYWEIEE